ncbi:hypothetical protein HJG54_18145 [Leptolyngbya sp. NK1-12]|uniref:Uncharacterized protein n=1 Tax=Leptolyngbya sp. NK1-12 TaxID=2547451 RepID=A0AA97AHI9_9CYAN|nr:hypothetical protein [Leptolyngbya sp. NK1-12]WNZ24584.1 hypothetical protein HJG54_18145 [Leptolyngbya sp. NK1-12]
MPSLSLLSTLLNQFQSRYPMGCLCAELLTIHEGHYVVRALVQLAGTTLATGMAAAPEIESAEDRAKLRALEAIGLGTSASALPPVSSSFLPLPLDANSPKSTASTQTQSVDQLHQPQEAKLGKANLALSAESLSAEPLSAEPLSAEHDASHEIQPVEKVAKPASVAPPLDSLTEEVPYSGEITTGDQGYFSRHSELASLMSSTSPVRSSAAMADNELAEIHANQFAAKATNTVTGGDEIKTTGTPRAAKTEKSSKRKSDAFELPPVPPPQNTSDRSEEIMKIGIEMKRLGWSTEQGREYLKRTYGKRSRQELDDAELLDFLHYLEGQPSPLQTPF